MSQWVVRLEARHERELNDSLEERHLNLSLERIPGLTMGTTPRTRSPLNLGAHSEPVRHHDDIICMSKAWLKPRKVINIYIV